MFRNTYISLDTKNYTITVVGAINIIVLESQTTLGHSARVMHKESNAKLGLEQKLVSSLLHGDVSRPQRDRFR